MGASWSSATNNPTFFWEISRTTHRVGGGEHSFKTTNASDSHVWQLQVVQFWVWQRFPPLDLEHKLIGHIQIDLFLETLTGA
jgi:hypothetical protein